MLIFKKPVEFVWDRGNKDKNLVKHRVSNQECEEAFFDDRKKITKDLRHSKREKRYILLAKTKKGRLLFIVFTFRNKKIRVISARDINKKEVHLYEEAA